MQPFTFHSPTRIIFGDGAVSRVVDLVAEYGGKHTLIVTDGNLGKITAAILRSYKISGVSEPIIYDDVLPDAHIECVNKAVELARRNHCDSVVAVGGGSVMDTAKVANICLTFGGEVLEYQGLNNLPSRLLPFVAIPTTAGTGSEVSPVASVKHSQEKTKLLFGSRFLAPDVAILDPELIVSLPPVLTAATGMDALTHGLESYVAAMSASPISDALCLESMRLMFANLLVATKNGADLSARSATLVGSTMAGLAFTNTGVGIVHALSHAIGAWFNTHHGMTNAVFLPYGMEFNLPVVADRYASVSRFLGISDSKNDEQAASALIASIRSLIDDCGLPSRLEDMGVPKLSDQDLIELAEQVITDPAIMFNPRESMIQDVIAIFKGAY